jgi:hypothetical protein
VRFEEGQSVVGVNVGDEVAAVVDAPEFVAVVGLDVGLDVGFVVELADA